MLRLVCFLVLAIGTGFGSVDALVTLRSDLVPSDVDMSHRWDDLFDLGRRVVSYGLTGSPDLYEAPPFGEQRVEIARMVALIAASCGAAFLVGGIAALGRPVTLVFAAALALATLILTVGGITFSPKPVLQQALEALAAAALASALLGHLAAHALRRL